MGGFSGLYYEGRRNGIMNFLTVTDRGPNPLVLTEGGKTMRPFGLPNFQPKLIRIKLDEKNKEVSIAEEIPLTIGKNPVSGIPNSSTSSQDEFPVDVFGKPIALDPNGLDLEALTTAPDGSFWMAEEYAPSLCHFSKWGQLMNRFVPMGAKVDGRFQAEILPAVFSKKQRNRGFESIGTSRGKIFTIMQSPLKSTNRRSVVIRMLEFDMKSEKISGQYLYILESGDNDKIGDMSIVGEKFFVLEHNEGRAPKDVFEFNLGGATNLENKMWHHLSLTTKLEELSKSEILKIGIQPLKKRHIKRLNDFGYSFSKPEGLAMFDGTMAILNDNDFGFLGMIDFTSGKLTRTEAIEPSTITLMSYEK